MSHPERPRVRRALTTPPAEGTVDRSSATERSALLAHHKSERQLKHGISSSALRQAPLTRSNSNSASNRQHITSLRWALTRTLDRNFSLYRQNTATPAFPEKFPFDAAPAYDQFTSIDWIRDTVMNATRAKRLAARKNSFIGWLDDVQGWVLAALVGFVTAVLAYLIDITEPILFDLKLGYCKIQPFSSRNTCCLGARACEDWFEYNSVKPLAVSDFNLGFPVYSAIMLALSLLSCILVLSHRRAVAPKMEVGSVSQRRSSAPKDAQHPRGRPAAIYPAAGSGVAEVKVIASGFIIHGFLGLQTLVVKAVSCTIGVASGLSIGKEGPYVHMAACIGNILAKLFPKYRSNSGNRREIISAASAAGVAVAFGAPISGVLFSLEEVSYYFPSKTLLRTFVCSIVAAVTLRFLNPYGTSNIVMFQVKYHKDWRAAEMVFFVLLGVLGGALGSLFVKGTRLWAQTVRQIPIIKKSPLFEVALVALISAAASYWNHYTILPVTELMYELTSDCHNYGETGNGLCPEPDEIPTLLLSLGIALLIKAFLTTIAYGLKVPAGIYVPSMAVGALLGRGVAHGIQWILMTGAGSNIWGSCAIDGKPESCLVPGVYALLAAGSVMVGVTRLTITIVLMLFELSGSLEHVLPFAIAVMAAKWTADYVEPLSIYDVLLEDNDYPFLESKTRPVLTGELADIMPLAKNEKYIDISNGVIVGSLELAEKLEYMIATGQTDGGLPIIKHGVFAGIVSCPELAYSLEAIDVLDDVPCLVAPEGRFPETGNDEDEQYAANLTSIIDSAPLCLDIHSSLVLVYECFVRLGVRYIPVLRDGFYVGLIHKKAFLKYVRDSKDRA